MGIEPTTFGLVVRCSYHTELKQTKVRVPGIEPGSSDHETEILAAILYSRGGYIEYNRKCPPWGSNPRPYG